MHPVRARSWPDLPAGVRAEVEELLGAAVVAWTSCRGGFSPGSADVVALADGRRAFVKAVSVAVDPVAPVLHREEARVLASLTGHVPPLPVPALLGVVDDGSTVALVVQHVPGRQLGSPWTAPDLARAVAALEALAAATTPCPPGLPPAGERLGPVFGGWARLAADPDPSLDPWAARHLAGLAELAATAVRAADGATLVHNDVRGDNLVLGPDGVVVVDWPHACRGADWLDSLALVLNALVDGGLDPEPWLARSRVLAGADPHEVTAVLAGMVGYFLDAARQPPSPALPTVRAFQRVQGETGLGWLRRRLPGWR